MKTALIIHGHFYQPPRENPYNGEIPLQESAKPYANWNEAIFATCYKPNAYSRYLNYDGKILDISNNYCNMSVNFGPTLLSWIQTFHPNFMEKLKEAHKESIRRTGHSNFLAQCYNHVILPLQKPYIQRLQIKWAIDDYKLRFGTRPEGFWCSECAISKTTIDLLAENKIKFVVLSPWQAHAIGTTPLNGKPAPCDRPFFIEGNKRKICAFFYDPDLASGISFGHYLTDADRLYEHLKKLRKERRNPSLISCATDGEIYGHHEAFGDMAFAALVKKVSFDNEFELTNYAAYLEANMPTETAVLWEGEDSKGSSWSCCHGVGRWERDCGCHTGGNERWNQKWRAPLRKAFDNLEQEAYKCFSSLVKQILGQKANAYKILANYSCVLLHKKLAHTYVSSLKDNLSSDDIGKLVSILDAMKNIMFMYTSCGWFFNDISGLEPRQNISYAMYAAYEIDEICATSLKDKLLKDLKAAKSNISSESNGQEIALSDFKKYVSNEVVKLLAYYNNLILSDEATNKDIKDLLEKLEILRNEKIQLDITELQNSVFPIVCGKKKSSVSSQLMKQLAIDLNFLES